MTRFLIRLAFWPICVQGWTIVWSLESGSCSRAIKWMFFQYMVSMLSMLCWYYLANKNVHRHIIDASWTMSWTIIYCVDFVVPNKMYTNMLLMHFWQYQCIINDRYHFLIKNIRLAWRILVELNKKDSKMPTITSCQTWIIFKSTRKNLTLNCSPFASIHKCNI